MILSQISKIPTPDNNVFKVVFIAEETQYIKYNVAPSSILKTSANTINSTMSVPRRR